MAGCASGFPPSIQIGTPAAIHPSSHALDVPGSSWKGLLRAFSPFRLAAIPMAWASKAKPDSSRWAGSSLGMAGSPWTCDPQITGSAVWSS